jgi:phospholipase/carboxylesterase
MALVGASMVAESLGCMNSIEPLTETGSERLVIPTSSSTAPPQYGLHPLGLGGARDGLLYVPASYLPDRPAPLMLLFHGAGGAASGWFGSYGARAEGAGTIMLAPDSRGPTWDVVMGGFGPDVAFINRALAAVFERYRVDRSRIAIAGFSDGATYALSLGLANGDVVPNVIAFSPGFVAGTVRRGTPAFFLSHGTSDPILPIDQTSRPLVAALRQAGYQVQFTEFDGVHEVPQEISDAAFVWLRGRQG